MTQAFLESTVIDKNNIHLFLKAISPEAIGKVKKVDEKRKKEKAELFKMVNLNPSKEEIDKIMEKYKDGE